MQQNQYKYIIEICRADGTRIGQAATEPDWEPAGEYARLTALRQGHMMAATEGHEFSIDPRWHPDFGQPHISGVRIRLTYEQEEFACDLPVAWFRSYAKQAAAQLVERGLLSDGDEFGYLVSAYPRPAGQPETHLMELSVERVRKPLPCSEGALSALCDRATLIGSMTEADIPVLVPQRVLDEITALTHAVAARQETGGLLIGHLRSDPDIPEIFLEVTTQLPARHTIAELTKLTFTSETWTEAQAALDLRRRNEIFLGWWHSHPVRQWQCRDCPPERQRVCHLASFFSEHDRALHRTIFPRAYSVALVANDVAFGDLTFSLFGWRQGQIGQRGFYVMDAQTESD